MEVLVEVSGGVATVTLAGQVRVGDLGPCRDALLGALAGARVLALRLGGVDGADVSLLQLLCAAHRSAVAAGSELAFADEPSAILASLAERAGEIGRAHV
jgi:hypothetical protein